MAPEVNKKLGKLIFGDSESNLKLVLRYSVVQSASLFLRVRKSNFKIIFAPSLRSLRAFRQSLVN